MVLQFSAPILVENLEEPFKPKRLARLRTTARDSATRAYAEKLLQEIIHSDPSVLPVEELEPSFSDLRPVCQELPLANGTKYIDNLLVNPDGRICIVECKLWRNPEAVREVVAQILDYAAELSNLSYDQLEETVARVLGRKKLDCLVQTVLGDAPGDEQKIAFIDAVSRSLRTGGFLLLIVGDGIRSGLQQIAGLLQNKATLGFSLGLIEMAIYGNGTTGPFYIQPRLLLRTETITRTVLLSEREVSGPTIKSVSEASKPRTISEQDFFRSLGSVDPSYPSAVSDLIDRTRTVGCQPELKRTFVIYADIPSGGSINLGQIAMDGKVTIWGAASRDLLLGEPVGRTYMESVVRLVPGADIKDDLNNPNNWYVRFNKRSAIPLKELLSRESEWISAMAQVVQKLQQNSELA
jgi:hypothetical protein